MRSHRRCSVCRAARAEAAKSIYQPRDTPQAMLRRARREQVARGVLTCTDCAQTRPLAQFVRIRQSREAYYGRCRICRARRARERYNSKPDVRAAEIARAWKNKQDRRSRRRLQAAAAMDQPSHLGDRDERFFRPN